MLAPPPGELAPPPRGNPRSATVVVSTPAGITAKIADFGLCKILEPDQSTMSSNVGTLTFKAPELWNPKSHKRVRYNRTVDVYAAGLTFAAILQAVKGRSLKPKVRQERK